MQSESPAAFIEPALPNRGIFEAGGNPGRTSSTPESNAPSRKPDEKREKIAEGKPKLAAASAQRDRSNHCSFSRRTEMPRQRGQRGKERRRKKRKEENHFETKEDRLMQGRTRADRTRRVCASSGSEQQASLRTVPGRPDPRRGERDRVSKRSSFPACCHQFVTQRLVIFGPHGSEHSG